MSFQIGWHGLGIIGVWVTIYSIRHLKAILISHGVGKKSAVVMMIPGFFAGTAAVFSVGYVLMCTRLFDWT